MPALRLELYKKVFLQDYQVTHPEQYKMYEEVLSFEGGYAFASEDELTVRKTDGSTFAQNYAITNRIHSLKHIQEDLAMGSYSDLYSPAKITL